MKIVVFDEVYILFHFNIIRYGSPSMLLFPWQSWIEFPVYVLHHFETRTTDSNINVFVIYLCEVLSVYCI